MGQLESEGSESTILVIILAQIQDLLYNTGFQACQTMKHRQKN